MAKESLDEKKQPESHNEDARVEVVPVTDGGEILLEPPGSEVLVEVEQRGQGSERREIVRSASLVMLGNLGSSIMGMVRQIVVASIGASISAPFLASLTPSQTFNDLIVNGSVPGALIPTLNDYAAPEKQEEMRRVVFTIVNLVVLIMAVASIAYFFIAPWFVDAVIARGYTPEEKQLTLQFTRIIFFSTMGLAPFSALQAALYARKEFGWTAFATTSFHVGIIVGAVIGAILGQRYFGQYGLALGVLLGVLGEIALLIPGMRNQHLRYMFVLDLKHPALRRILKLYAPVAFSFLVSAFLIFLDQSLASMTPCAAYMTGAKDCGAHNYSAMRYATTLIQFPGGLVAAALSFAVLPTLTAYAREKNSEQFKDTLLLGFRLGLLLMIPAAAGLIVLQLPIVSLIFQRHGFTPQDSQLTATALNYFSFQLPFLAIDQLLISAFYARKNTIIPVAVQLVSILGYLAVALPFWSNWGMPALALANAVQNSSHAIVLLVILRITIGPLKVRSMIPVVCKILVATVVMVGLAWGLQLFLGHVGLFSTGHFVGLLLTVVVVGGLAAAAYFAVAMLLKVEEVAMLKGIVQAKLGKK